MGLVLDPRGGGGGGGGGFDKLTAGGFDKLTAGGFVWVADQATEQVLVFDKAGNYLESVGSQASNPLLDIQAVALDGQGGVYATDALNAMVDQFLPCASVSMIPTATGTPTGTLTPSATPTRPWP